MLAVERDVRNVLLNVGLPFSIIQLIAFTTFGYEHQHYYERVIVVLSLLLTAVAFKFVMKVRIEQKEEGMKGGWVIVHTRHLEFMTIKFGVDTVY